MLALRRRSCRAGASDSGKVPVGAHVWLTPDRPKKSNFIAQPAGQTKAHLTTNPDHHSRQICFVMINKTDAETDMSSARLLIVS